MTHGGAYPAGGGYPHDDDDDLRGAASIAAKEAPEDQSFFDEVLGGLLRDKPKAKLEEEDLDEDGTHPPPHPQPTSPPFLPHHPTMKTPN